MKHFLELTTTGNVREQLSSLGDRSLVVYSPTSLSNIGPTDSEGLFIDSHAIGKDAEKIEGFCATQEVDTVIGLGGGTAIDIAKYAATLIGCEFVCMPTMLSTNAFATNKVALMRNSTKITLDARLPDRIILDSTLISEAGMYNLYGLCDILSIHTALYDWLLADQAGVEKIDPKIYKMSRKLLEGAIHYATESGAPASDDIPALYSLIGESGHITNIYGSGRPESGSEHIFAKELERRVEIPHGISIAIGITVMSQLQGNYSAGVQDALVRTGVMENIAKNYDLRDEVEASLRSLLPRSDRYTILDEKLPRDDSGRLTDTFYMRLMGAFDECSYR